MNEQLENEKYAIIRNAVSEDILSLAKTYYQIKFLIRQDYRISAGMLEVGDGPDTVQPFNKWSYGDMFAESLLVHLLPKVREVSDIETLEPSYGLVRFYENGQRLVKHRDRPSCQYSITLPLVSFDNHPWSIFVNGSEVDLNLGDLVIYKGCEALHWREPYEGTYQLQAHLHYVNVDEDAYAPYKYDNRPSIGSLVWNN